MSSLDEWGECASVPDQTDSHAPLPVDVVDIEVVDASFDEVSDSAIVDVEDESPSVS